MQFKKLHCWDCGVQVIGYEQGKCTLLPNFQQVKFNLSNGSYMENPFCRDCAARPWSASRLEAFRKAITYVDPRFNSIAVTEMVELTPRPDTVAGVV